MIPGLSVVCMASILVLRSIWALLVYHFGGVLLQLVAPPFLAIWCWIFFSGYLSSLKLIHFPKIEFKHRLQWWWTIDSNFGVQYPCVEGKNWQSSANLGTTVTGSVSWLTQQSNLVAIFLIRLGFLFLFLSLSVMPFRPSKLNFKALICKALKSD